jgi:adenylosuccinate synthase
MPVIAVIGAQWANEGKGHLMGLLAERARLVIRYGSGHNTDHILTNTRGSFNLQLLPSGIFDPSTVNVLGNGMILDPARLLQEIAQMNTLGVNTAKLFISDRAHVIMPYHILQDQLDESQRGESRIGTTGRGIGPALADKMARIGIRMGDLLYEDTLLSRLRHVLEFKNKLLTGLYGAAPLSLHEVYLRYLDYGRQLADYVTDTHPLIHRALERDVAVLLEGSQGALLDVDHGTYPFVTSAPPGAAGACQGTGISPTSLNAVVGVYKAYMTRSGAGPFPTQLAGEEAEPLRQANGALDEQSGQILRVGWFDAVLGRYAVQINGIDTVALTRLDALDSFSRIKICVGYRLHDTELEYPPANIGVFGSVEPIYEELPGWQTSTRDTRRFEALPREAQQYVARICALIGTRIGIVSVGPEREQIIEVNRLL